MVIVPDPCDAALPATSSPARPAPGESRSRHHTNSTFATALLPLAARPTVPRVGTWTVIVGNVAWVLGSIGVVVAGRDWTALGVGVVLAQAGAVAVFAELEWLGLRRATPAG
jgi:hypothetical protein